jgi:hypothetical protein
LDPWTDPGDGRREPIVDGERGTLLRLARRLAMLLLSANVSFVHTGHMRKRDAARPGTAASHADREWPWKHVSEATLGGPGGH